MLTGSQKKENHLTKEQNFDNKKTTAAIGTLLLGITMHYKLKDLIKENIMLEKLTDLNNVPLHDYIELVKVDGIGIDLDGIINDAEDMLQDLKANYDMSGIIRKWYYEKLCDIFNLYFFSLKSKKYIDNGKYDDNGIPKYYPDTIREFIIATYPVFESIRNTKSSYDFAGLLIAENDKEAWRRTYLNRIKILTLILMGKIRSGRNITRLLFEKSSSDTKIPEPFKRLCRIKNAKYIICNTDWYSLDFQLAVFDLIKFEDPDNKIFFDAKVNQYLNAYPNSNQNPSKLII